MNKIVYYLTAFVLTATLVSCDVEYVPKPVAYPKLELPEKAYTPFSPKDCPFSFSQASYTTISHSPTLKRNNTTDKCWFDIDYGPIGATIHLSYKEISSLETLSQLIEDDYKLTAKHIRKAEFIDKREIATKNDAYGIFADVGGNAASHMQFFLTDSTDHFIRGSLYFNTTPNYDSIRPAVEFIKTDVLHLIDSFEWK